MKSSQPQPQFDNSLHIDMHHRRLDWTKTLFDYHICIDAEAFDKWNRNMEMPSQDVLEKDIPRTRSTQPQMSKESFKDVLRRLATFYCQQNGVNYQQGLLEVVFPFALLRRKDFSTKKCYAYFNAFMRKHFPKVLVQRVIKNRKELPHAMVALTLTECLLNYHYPAIAHGLRREQVQMSLIATQELMTVFAKDLEMEYVFEVYDYFIKKNDPNYVFYMMIGLFGIQEQRIMEALACDSIHKLTCNFKDINSPRKLKQWLALSEQIAQKTPPMFGSLAEQFRFSNNNILTVEDLQKMLNSSQILPRGLLPVSIEEIDKDPSAFIFIIIKNKLNTNKYSHISIDPSKQADLSQLSPDKTYVLAAHEDKKAEEMEILAQMVDRNPSCRFLILKEPLIANQKNKNCRTF